MCPFLALVQSSESSWPVLVSPKCTLRTRCSCLIQLLACEALRASQQVRPTAEEKLVPGLGVIREFVRFECTEERIKNMGDVKLAASTHVSKTSLTMDHSGVGSMPLTEAPAFIFPPRNLCIKEGATAKFEGRVRGYPEPQVTWHRNGQPITSGGRFLLDCGTRGTFSLVIHAVREEDKGKYTCEATNGSGARQVTVELTVEVTFRSHYELFLPRSSSWIRKLTPAALLALLFNCFLLSTAAPHPGPAVPGVLLVQTPHQQDTRMSRDRFAAPAVETRPSIWGECPPKFATKLGRAVVKEGQMGRFSCKITGRPQPRVTWLKGDIPLQPSARVSMSEKNGMQVLEIHEVSRDDVGVYTCLVVNGSGKASMSAELSIQGLDSTNRQSGLGSQDVVSKAAPRRISTESQRDTTAPRFESKPQSQEVSEDQTVKFKCEAADLENWLVTPVTFLLKDPAFSGIPKPEVTWFLDGAPVKRREGTIEIYEDGGSQYLCLRRARARDSGNYTCTAANVRGQVSCSWTLLVRRLTMKDVAPSFSSVLKDCAVVEGQDFVLQCSVQGIPVPRITWLLNEQPIQYAHSTCEAGVAELHIQDALPEDDGMYTCLAENTLGQVSCSARVTVRECESPGPSVAL
ncbi:hypothetical protein CB1_001278010 [Camelus ferus]|nr:hypothetical protein CB1_001278010 [Camelus ferus]